MSGRQQRNARQKKRKQLEALGLLAFRTKQQETQSVDCGLIDRIELDRWEGDGGSTTPVAKTRQPVQEDSSIDTEDLKKPIPNFAEVSEQDRKPVVKLDNFDTENEQTQSQISTFQSRSENMFSDDSPFPDSSFDDQSSFPLSVDLKYGDTKILQKSVSRGWTPGHYPTDLTWEELQEIRKSGRRLTAKEIVIENIHRLMKNPKTIEKGISLMLRCEEHNRKVDAAIAAVEAARRRQFPSTVPAGCIPPVNPPVSDSKPPNVSISIQNTAAASATAAPVAAEPKKFRTEWIIRLPHNGRGPKL